MQPLLQLADRAEVLIHALLIALGKRAVEAVALLGHEVEHTAALTEGLRVGLYFRGFALHEELLEQLARAFLRRNWGAAAREAQRRSALIGHRQRQRGEAGVVADLLGG